MNVRLRHVSLALALAVSVWVAGIAITGRAAAQAPPAKQQTAGEAFKNVTTSTLKGLTVSDFLGAMGVMAAALGYDCADCHPGAGSDKVDWVFDTPKKKTARRMVEMLATINKTHFAGVQSVTCFTCHHGKDLPTTTIALDTLYGPPNSERRDVVTPITDGPTATQILDKYIAALGGAQKLAGLTSWVATGSSLGYEGLGGGGVFQIFAKAPDQHTVQVVFKDHPERGDNTRAYDGKVGWVKSPRGLLAEFEQTGTELDGRRLDALLAFPGNIKTVFPTWRVGQMESLGDKDYNVLQGSGPRGLLATFYFDTKTNLLTRYIRYGTSPIGRISVQLDYADYRDVGGIKFPYTYTFSWLDGKDNFKISDVKVNVPINATQFGKPK